ncbi:MAG: HPr kinase/phosphorylase [Sphingomonadaceae bacterium]
MPSSPQTETIHADCVEIDGRAVLIFGASGTGKSDLALRLIDRGAKLVSDDYTLLRREADRLIASAPATITGKIEVRGVGIMEWPSIPESPVALCIMLGQDVERMPPDPLRSHFILGAAVPSLPLDALQTSAPIKVELAARVLVDAWRHTIQGS